VVDAAHIPVADPLDDLSRDVYCVLGIPVDAVDMSTVRQRVATATERRRPFLISTANLNFLISSLSQREFRDSLIQSDLCTADGIGVVWLARLLGIPIRHRIAGADFLEAFRAGDDHQPPLKLYLFGGAQGVAAAAARAINARADKLRCVGWHYPGFASAKDLSKAEILDEINGSGADFLLASLGAAKGQSWLLDNHDKLRIPVRAHVGATLNFVAGALKRAPRSWQKSGLEWLWRIKEEPHLWRRYWNDGRSLAALLLRRALPLVLWRFWLRISAKSRPADVIVTRNQAGQPVSMTIVGPATVEQTPRIVEACRQALATKSPIVIDLSETTDCDARFLGLLLVLRKLAIKGGRELTFRGLSPRLRRMLQLNGVAFLTSSIGVRDGAGSPGLVGSGAGE
jgi:N-acetylglucosaminyldiphosphoundecaprenol N-acetyl-beta-D-mannosaminyltransferase